MNCVDDEAMDPDLKDLVPDFRQIFSVVPCFPFLSLASVYTDVACRRVLLLRWNGHEHNEFGCTLSNCLPIGDFDVE